MIYVLLLFVLPCYLITITSVGIANLIFDTISIFIFYTLGDYIAVLTDLPPRGGGDLKLFFLNAPLNAI